MPLRADAAGLRAVTAEALAEAFQVGADNPLVGLDGRVTLLRRLGDTLAQQPDVFGALGRPGALFDLLCADAQGGITAHAVLVRCSTRCPKSGQRRTACPTAPRSATAGASRRRVAKAQATAGCRFTSCRNGSAIRCWSRSNGPGVAVTGLDALTGLPEYRNGGLLLDSGVCRA